MRKVACVLALMSVLGWHEGRAQVVAFGASNVFGWGVDATEAFPARLQSALRAEGYPTMVLNAGMFGNTTVQMRARMERDIPSGTTIVLLDVSGGLYNDSLGGVSREQGKADLQAITAALEARAIKVIPIDFSTVPAQYLQGDRRHLTAEGHEWLSSKILPQVKMLLGPAPDNAARSTPSAAIQECTAAANQRCASRKEAH
jgi:acyl-CoA thioesterase-1